MGCHIRWSDKFGANFGHRFTLIVLILTSIYLLSSLIFTLVARLYLHSYYNSAHIAGLSVVVAIFVICHHCWRLNNVLSCKIRPFFVMQSVINMCILLCLVVMALAYTILTGIKVHVNYDNLAAMILSWLDVALMLYLLVLSIHSAYTTFHFSYEVSYRPNDIPMDTTNHTNQNGVVPTRNLMDSSAYTKPTGCGCCCSTCLGILFGVVHILLAVVLLVSAYYPITLIHDLTTFRRTGDMYTVKVPGHTPLAMYLRCRGNGTDTILYENGLGGLALMQWDFMPRYLQDRYRTCVYDRRGYGWSEGYSWDYIETPNQWAKPNVIFMKQLVKAAGIKTPFYYVGHSYGGLHLAYAAQMYPELLKGIVFFDTASFAPLDEFLPLLQVINNVKPLGVVYFAMISGLLNFKKVMGDSVSTDRISSEALEEIEASMRSGQYMEAVYTESLTFTPTELNGVQFYSKAAAQFHADLGTDVIETPLLVIDANATRNSVPTQVFARYDDDFHLAVTGAEHSTLVYGSEYNSIIAELVDTFIKLTNKQISRDKYNQLVGNMNKVVRKSSDA